MNKTKMNRKGQSGLIGFGILAVFVIFILFSSIYTIQSGQEGVLLTFNKANPVAKEPGFHMKVPIVQKVAKFDMKTLKYVAPASSASKDLQIVSTQLAVNYRLAAGSSPDVFTEVGMAYEDRVIQPLVQEVVKSTTAKFTAEELITKRSEVKEVIKSTLSELLDSRDVIVEEVSMTDFDFSPEFNAAIEQKVTAAQNALKAEQDLLRIEIEAQQREARAIGEKQASIAEAEGQAQRISLVQEELSKSPQYIKWLTINNWDGALPKVTGNGGIPLINIPME